MTYWNRMFPRINQEPQYFRGQGLIWYSVEIGGDLKLTKSTRPNDIRGWKKKEIDELVYDNTR